MNQLFIRGLTIDWSQVEGRSYLHEIEALSQLEHLELNSPITFFVGENGSGKSTLMEAIAIAAGFNPEGGTKNYNFSTYDSHSELHEAMRLSRGYRKPFGGYFLRAESFYNVATQEAEYGLDGGYHTQSHGESFLALAQAQLRPRGLYLFDEPEAALSPQRQLTLMLEIYRCAKEGAQFIIVTHSPILLAVPGAEILTFDEGTIHPCQYEDTDSYQITKMFMEDRERILTKLLGEEDV